MFNSAKLFGVVLGIAAMAQVEMASANCTGPKDSTFSPCFGSSSGQGTRQGSQVKADLANGTSATLLLFNSAGNPISTGTCTRPRDTAVGLGNLSSGAIRTCSTARSIQLSVIGP